MRKVLTILIFLFCGILAHAQNSVSGKVTDSSGEGIPGANIVIKGTTNGTVSDIDGNYTLNGIPSDAILQVSFIGYTTQDVQYSGQATLDVVLESDALSLEEVVVTGYGQSQNKRAISTAISTVSSKQIETVKQYRPESALQGAAPGIVVVQTSGSPGAPLTVRMRGIGTPNQSEPLYLVNGIQVPNLEYLNASDIKNISILKDAASAAIYGSRGGNGVVLVQTKSGRRNMPKPNVSVSGYYGFQNLAYKPDLMDKDQYIDYYNQSIDDVLAGGGTVNGRGKFTDSERAALPNTDWYDEVFEKNSPMQNYHFSVSDGGDKYSYELAAGYFGQDGMVGGEDDKSNYNRKNVRFSFDTDITSNLILKLGGDFTRVERNFLVENSGGTGTALMNYITAIPSIYPTRAENDELFNMGRQNPSPVYNGVPLNVLGAVTHPLWSIEITNRQAVQDVKLLSGSLNWNPVSGLDMNASYSYYQLDGLLRSFTPKASYPEQTFTTEGNVNYQESPYSTKRNQFEATAEYTFQNTSDHNLKILGGFSYIDSYIENPYVSGGYQNYTDYLTNDFDDVNFQLATDHSSFIYNPYPIFEDVLTSFFGRATYDYQQKYLLTASLRVDGSSKFGANERYGIFPAVSAGWVISEENFLQSSDNINLLKLRASWGVNGSDNLEPYRALSTVDANTSYGPNTGLALTGLANPNLKWEEIMQTNFGLDLNAFNNTLGITVDYYIKETSDILLAVGSPTYIGLNPAVDNVGSVKNSGFEFMTTYNKRYNNGFAWNASFNIGINENEVTSLGDNGQPLDGGFTGQLYADPITRTDVGHSISSFYGYEVEGIDAVGNLLFKDNDNSGNDKTRPNEGDKTYIGNPFPDFTYGINLGASVAGFDFSAFFYGSQGNDIFDATIRYDAIGSNRPSYYAKEGAPRSLVVSAAGDTNGENLVSDFHVKDGSFFRLKNATIGYTLPENVSKKVYSEKIRLYVSGQNLFTITGYDGVEPEIGEVAKGSSLDIGIDRGFYPQPITVIFGFQLNF
ncbi:TonB-linked outer membrane protein, SusC/RagA family [Mariniphaga anaerophila]|uniref:TonB-linked outer membrane protein, SusC/RagA family n=1 Tax=Mariniphaga anaerophila TaxID=1484053 RepID=A0A1M4U745_9BACT|nr:TonB-dependent receptor [Mariniphaga anaerophila]SHE52417.1 TonB-linked outer membrane protein, SusC/RagA family [Mariniphaga anaerophila]